MGSVVLKLLPTTRNFWLLFLLPSWVWLLLSQDMATMVMDMAMAMDMDMDMATMDTMARGPLRPSLDMVIMAMDMAMVTMDIMARGPLMPSQLPLLSQDMDMVMDMVMDTMDIMARGPLMLNPAMDIMVMDMVMDMAMAMDMVTDAMDMDMAVDMDIMVRQEPACCYFLEFSTTEVDQNRSSQKQTHILTQGNKYL